MGFRFSKTDVCWNAMSMLILKPINFFNERPMNVIIRWSFYFVEKRDYLIVWKIKPIFSNITCK